MNNNFNTELEKRAEEIRELEKQLIEDINKERVAKGKEPLEVEEYFIDKISEELKKNNI